ncbi:MAG: hypothetical protein ACRD23_08120 [Terriglobales bacterium]
MTIRKLLSRCLLLLFVMPFAGPRLALGVAGPGNPGVAVFAASTQQSTGDVTGTWSGTFQSRQPHFSPFTITMVIGTDASGHLVGTSSVGSDCLKNGSFQVTVNGSAIVLAGGDDEGNHITFRGTIDRTGTLLNLNYILNSSASARCESDDGTGTMGRR